MEAASSLRDYAIMAEKGKVWFDSEKYDRCASAGLQTKCMCTSHCWKLPNAVERPISMKCERQIGRASTMWTPKEQPWCTSNGKDRWSLLQQKTCLEWSRPTSCSPTRATHASTGYPLFDVTKTASRRI